MGKKITLFCFDETGTPIKETTVSKIIIKTGILLIVLIVAGLAFGIHDYRNAKKKMRRLPYLEAQIAIQERTISDQHMQIINFASKLNQLKADISELDQFEQKIRIIADLDVNRDDGSTFGIGGSLPEDLDTEMALVDESHTSFLREMHEHTDQVATVASLQKDDMQRLLKALKTKRNILAATPSIRPTQGWKTSGFGYRRSPFTGRKEFHKGIDIAAREGTPIIAPANGVVSFTGKKGLIGKMIAIQHGHGMATRYGHCSKILKKKGENVKRGEIIALIGNTGRSTGPHLHYEVRVNGVPVNPEKYILN
jgi:murein DD-endopeptidase MepM/ murein hydrolase activator NlpD